MSEKKIAKKTSGAITESWSVLTRYTQARIGQGRAGCSLPTKAQLQFNLDHAMARDAVNIPADMESLAKALQEKHIASVKLHSKAENRRTYLQRPDLGRRLNSDSISKLEQMRIEATEQFDVALILIDGLSSAGVQQHGALLCEELIQQCTESGFTVSPVFLVEQGRVAVGDEIGELTKAKFTLLIVGERPGLSSPDSLGIYFTYSPKVGLNDAYRNCISNIRPAGMTTKQAAHKALWLLNESTRLGLSGVKLKDTSSETDALDEAGIKRNFLIDSSGK